MSSMSMFGIKPAPLVLAGHTVAIMRNPRVRQLRLIVDPRSGQVRLTLPKRAALKPALSWAREQSDWVASEAAKLPAPQPIVPDMVFTVAGKLVQLDWSMSHPRVPQCVAGKVIVGGAETELSGRILRWLRREALSLLEAETREIAALAGVSVGRVGVGDTLARWGSCTAKGDIRYSWRLILVPTTVRRATVAHEVAHRLHMNHSSDFHACAQSLDPASQTAARQWLKQRGAALHWFGRPA